MIQKGEPWGRPGVLPPGGVVVSDDAEARRVVQEARRRNEQPPVLGLAGGDLCRTLGGPGRLQTAFDVDLGEVLVDGRLFVFVAHLVARNRWWTRVFAAMNAEHLGRWDVAPRGHPGDGRLDVYDAQLTPSDLWKVRARLPMGAHLPHPRIDEQRVPAAQVELEHPLPVRLDGEVVVTGRTLSVRVEPAALTVVV